MGYTVLNKVPAAGWKDHLDRAMNGGAYTVKVSAIGSDGNYYAAIERAAGDGLPRIVYGMVGLIEGTAYKTMSEDMVPYYYAAPLEVLAALSPTTDAGALKWRARCMAMIEADRSAELQAERIREWRADDREMGAA